MMRARRSRDRGQTLVEFALVAPIFFLLVFGVMEGGYYAFAISSVQHGTQEGARLAILPSTPDVTAVKTRVQQRAQPIAVAATDIAVTVTGSTSTYGSRKRGDRVAVATTYRHAPLISYVFSGVTFPMNVRTELFVE